MKPEDLKIPFSWEERRPYLAEGLLYLPGYFSSFEDYNDIFTLDKVFPNIAPYVVEYCSGNGQWIIDRAKKDPTRNWIAVEKRMDRAWWSRYIQTRSR